MWKQIAGAATVGGAGLLGGIYSTERNIGFQREINAQNVALMRESWRRDDSAIQRRVADLKASGLSPVMAAGTAAAASSPIQLQAPKQTENYGDNIGKSIASAVQMAQIGQTRAGTEASLAQKNLLEAKEKETNQNVEISALKRDPQILLLNAQIAKAKTETQVKKLLKQIEFRRVQIMKTIGVDPNSLKGGVSDLTKLGIMGSHISKKAKEKREKMLRSLPKPRMQGRQLIYYNKYGQRRTVDISYREHPEYKHLFNEAFNEKKGIFKKKRIRR